MKVYISGRIKDYPEYLEHFARVEHQLRVRDLFDVVNPCNLEAPADATYEDFMRIDLKALLECDAVHMLIGWERSVGARCEHLVAAMCGLKITYEVQT